MKFYCYDDELIMCHKNVSTAWLCLSALYSQNLSPCRAQANAGRVPGPARLAAATDGCRAAGRRPALAGRDGRRRQLWQRRRVECPSTLTATLSRPSVAFQTWHGCYLHTIALYIYTKYIYIISTQWGTWVWDKWDTGSKETLTKWYFHHEFFLPNFIPASCSQ